MTFFFLKTETSSVSIKQVDLFFSGSFARLRCLPQEYNGQINWYKNLKPLDLEALSGVMSDDKTFVTFFNITSRLHNGVYSCENVLDNGQVIYSENFVTVQVQGKLANELLLSTGDRGCMIYRQLSRNRSEASLPHKRHFNSQQRGTCHPC